MQNDKKLLLNTLEYQQHQSFWNNRLSLINDSFLFENYFAFEQQPLSSKTHSLPLVSNNCQLIANIGKGKEIGKFVVFLSALIYLIYRYTGEEIIWLDSPLLQEYDQHSDVAEVVPLIFQINEDVSIRDLLRQVQETVSKSYTFQNFPIHKLWKESLVTSCTSLFISDNLIHSNYPNISSEYNFIFRVKTDNNDNKWIISFEDRQGFFPIEFVHRMENHLNIVLSQFMSLEKTLYQLEILSVIEKQKQLEELNQTDSPECISDHSVDYLFELKVQQVPNHTAVITKDRQLSYLELNEKANQLAHYLINEFKVAKGEVVAVVTNRSELAIIALMSILKVGGVYLPLSHKYPEKRIRQILEDSNAKVLLFHSKYFDLFGDCYDFRMFSIDIQLPMLETPVLNLDQSIKPDDLISIIYTSGSEGRPKGVLLDHQGLVNVVLGHIAELKITEEDRYLQFMSLSFDGSLLDIFTALLSGATLVMVSEEVLQNIGAFQDYIQEKKVTVFTITPSYLKLLDPVRLQNVRTIISAAETAKVSNAEFYSRTKDFYNGYGPTEVCVNATLHKVEAERKYFSIPLGKPSANKKLYVLDHRQRLLPSGAIGEIGISGIGLSRGYLNQPDITQRKFVPHPFIAYERLYLTGDLGAWNQRDELVFKGRKDHQVKIRGFRVELGEIEDNLLLHPNIQDAVVLFENQYKSLLGFFIGDGDLDKTELIKFLKVNLPEYMIPTMLYQLEKFPLTNNGKVDRDVLLEYIIRELAIEEEFSYPKNEVEEILLDIWREVLGVSGLNTHHDFFSMGGDSIRIIQAVHASQNRQIKIEMFDIINHRTITSLAEYIYKNNLFNCIELKPVPLEMIKLSEAEYQELPDNIEDAYPVSKMQELILRKYAEPLCSSNNVYHCVARWHIFDLSFSLEALKAAIQVLVKRHCSLRTFFFQSKASGRLLQAVKNSEDANICVFDLSNMSDTDQQVEIQKATLADCDKKYCLGDPKLPFVRFYIFVRSERSFELLMSAHHGVIDGWSGIELENEVFDLYHEFKTKKSLIGMAAPIGSYKEFIALEQEIQQSELTREFWRQEQVQAVNSSLPIKYSLDDDQVFGTLVYYFDTDVCVRLNSVAIEQHVTLKAACLSAFIASLHTYTQQFEVTVGVVVNGRSERMTEPFKTVGLFWNIVPFTSKLDSNEEITPITAIQERLNKIDQYARYPLTCMLENEGKEEFFYACFNFIHFHNARVLNGGLQLLDFYANDKFHYPITFIISALPQVEGFQFDLRVEYHRAYFNESDIDTLVSIYTGTLTTLI
jgi:amino acid adenylation domain-containing protein